MKNIVLPVLKDEAGQLIQDVTSGKGLKNSLVSSAKRVGKRTVTKVLTGKGKRRKRKSTANKKPVKRQNKRRRPRQTAQNLRKMLLMRLARKHKT